MREDIIEKAYAKINISLDVTARRDDGYHDMAMVMQTVSLCDDVRLGFTDGSRIFARTNLPFIPGDERNLAVRAAKKFFEAAGEPERGLCIRIDKRIPVGAGMAGGSTDAAAVLRGLNRAFGNRFGVERLEELGAEVGSDVAFCVRGGTMLARGRGELLTPAVTAAGLRFRHLQAAIFDIHAGAVPQARSGQPAPPSRHGGHRFRAGAGESGRYLPQDV